MMRELTGAMLIASLICAQNSADELEPLAPQLQEVAAQAADRLPAEVLRVFKQGVAQVKSTGIETSAKQVGDAAVDAELSSWDGNTHKLSELWGEHPIVLMWYRGGWCPYCNIQLRAMQKSLDALEKAGGRVVVLTPELPEKAKQTAETNDLRIIALHDKESELARAYGILFALPEPIVPMYRDHLKLASYNGYDAMELPLAATYVIDTSGNITYAFLDADYTKRAEPKDVIQAVQDAQ